MLDVVALGELLIDFTHVSSDSSGYPTLSAHPGGAPANFLAALNSHGARTALLSKVGNDSFGKMLINTLNSIGVGTSGIVVDDNAFTTLAFVTLDENGERNFSFARKPGADTLLRYEELDLSLIDKAKVFHFGSLSLTDEPARSTTYQAVEYAKSHGKLISYDPNLRPPLWKNLTEAKEQILWGLAQADVVKISDDEIRFLFDMNPPEGAAHILENYGVKLVFVTCGAKGAYFKNSIAEGFVPAPKVKAVDTTGAGDAFGGSAIWKLLQMNKSPDALCEKELLEIASFSCHTASVSTTKPSGLSSII